MLLHRSILLEVCLLLAVFIVKAQSRFVVDDKAIHEPTFDRPNYSKLFAEEASSPIAAKQTKKQKEGDYEVPIDYEKLFAPSPVYGASNKEAVKKPSYDFYEDEGKSKGDKLQPYESQKQYYPSYPSPLKEFFAEEQSRLQQQQSRDEEVVRPGPSYVSHQIPAYSRYGDEDKSSSGRESESVAASEERKKLYGNQFEEGTLSKDNDDYTLPQSIFAASSKKEKQEEYDPSRSSSQYPVAPDFTHVAAANTPYVKYTFQPVTETYQAQNSHRVFDTLIGTAEPYSYGRSDYGEPAYETQPSEDVPSQFQGKGCKKVSSEGDMNCFVCENEKTNAKYTQCNYKSKKEPVSFYQGNSAKYSMPHRTESGRYKRYADKGESDPYTLIKSRSLKSFDRPNYDFNAGFQYEPEHYDESKSELTYSEQHAEELKKNPDNCKNVERKGMTCTVCKDPKTGGNFEQCSYTSSPKEKKYAYVTEKKYDNEEPEAESKPETKTVELTGESKVNPASSQKDKENLEEYQGNIHQEKSPRKRNEEGHDDYASRSSEKKPVDEAPAYEVPSHFSSIKSDGDYRGSGSHSSENVDSKNRKPEYSEDFSDFDEYHFKLFPEFAKQESRREDVVKQTYKIPDPKENYQIPEATKQNVESVLAEFSKKDRSNCKKAEKKGMTCYLCVDKNNIQHEECMYVQESRPQSSHVAYHQAKATNDKNEKEDDKQVPAESKRKHFFKKVTTPAPGLEGAASEQVGVVVAAQPQAESQPEAQAQAQQQSEESRIEKRSNIKEEEKEPKSAASDFDDESDRISDKGEPTINIPAHGTEEGVNVEETRPVYSKALGVKLPKYMLEKSEFEKEFDEFAGSF